MGSTLEGCKSLGGRGMGEYKSLGGCKSLGTGSGSWRGQLDMGLAWGRGLGWCKSLGVRENISIGA